MCAAAISSRGGVCFISIQISNALALAFKSLHEHRLFNIVRMTENGFRNILGFIYLGSS